MQIIVLIIAGEKKRTKSKDRKREKETDRQQRKKNRNGFSFDFTISCNQIQFNSIESNGIEANGIEYGNFSLVADVILSNYIKKYQSSSKSNKLSMRSLTKHIPLILSITRCRKLLNRRRNVVLHNCKLF